MFNPDNPHEPPTKEFIRNSLTYGLLPDGARPEDPNADLVYITRNKGRLMSRFFKFALENKEKIRRIPILGGMALAIKRSMMNKAYSAPNPGVSELDFSGIMGLEIDDFVRQLYLLALGRPPDASGLESCKFALNNGAKKEAIIYIICTSKEFANRARVAHLAEYRKAYSSYRLRSRLKRIPVLRHAWALVTLPRRVEGLVASLESAERGRYDALTAALESAERKRQALTIAIETINQRIDLRSLEMAITSINQKSDQNAILITKLHEKVDALHSIVASRNSIQIENKSNSQLDDQTEVLISNGLIDEESYLEKSLENEKMSVLDFKNKYDEDGWYFLFEKLFRGSEEEIAKRQSFYIGYVQECHRLLASKNKEGYVLDFGSGKGEFLTLLSQSGIPGKGVDTNCLNTEYVRKKGLDAICEDGIKYLENIKDNELFGITTFQVAEHLEFSTLKKFLQLAYQKIMPGGIIIIETVNPSCIYSLQYFYLDPTHIRPHPPETLRFYSEWLGFKKIKIAYYIPVNSEVPKEDTSNYMGYALIGYKPEDGNQLSSS